MKKYKLGEIAKVTSSKRIFENEYQTFGVPFLRGQEISRCSLDNPSSTYTCYISRERYEELKCTYGVPLKGDILITAVGTIGNAYLVNRDDDFYFKDGNILWIKDLCNLVYPQYLLLYLKSEYFVRQIKKSLIGAVQKALTIDVLNQVLIELPPIEIQTRLSEVLYSLNQKIALNRSINHNLPIPAHSSKGAIARRVA